MDFALMVNIAGGILLAVAVVGLVAGALLLFYHAGGQTASFRGNRDDTF